MKADIRDFTLEELTELIKKMGEPAHRARQIFRWLYSKNVRAFGAMTDLPKGLVRRLEDEIGIGRISCEEKSVSRDGTEKFLWKLGDGRFVESVLIRVPGEGGRRTLCLSTQVGCKFKCPFCASGAGGFTRNLRVSEILDQIVSVQEAASLRITNIVFMGMGEPLDNYDNVVKAIRIMNDPAGLGIGARKITVSTCGIVPAIRCLKDLGLQIELSVSLHSAEDALRDSLVPSNRKYPLKELESALKEYTRDTGRVITLEYTLISGVNDTDKSADKLAAFAKRIKGKVNLIACNPSSGKKGKPGQGRLSEFRKVLEEKGVTATIRRSKGDDIMAACGQLAARQRTENRGQKAEDRGQKAEDGQR